MMKEIMPIGSVVRIKAHQYLVAGYTSETKNGTNKLSYILFPWPAGYLSKRLCHTIKLFWDMGYRLWREFGVRIVSICLLNVEWIGI